MDNQQRQILDDGQPLVEFAPLQPAEFVTLGLSRVVNIQSRSDWRYVPVRRFG